MRHPVKEGALAVWQWLADGEREQSEMVSTAARAARACKAPLGMQQCVTYLGAPGLA